MDTSYSNVDLVIESKTDLTPLVNELGSRVFVLNPSHVAGAPLYKAELECFPKKAGPEGAVSRFCDLIEKLSATSKSIWKNCKKREFDIGFTAGLEPWPFVACLSTSTLNRVASLNATLAITIYPYRPASPSKRSPATTKGES